MSGVICVLCRQGQAGMRAAMIDEEGRHVSLPAERPCCVVDRELCERQLLVQIVLAAIGIRLQRVANNSVGPFHLFVGILVVHRADNDARAHALHEGEEHLARELGVVIHHKDVGPGEGAADG